MKYMRNGFTIEIKDLKQGDRFVALEDYKGVPTPISFEDCKVLIAYSEPFYHTELEAFDVEVTSQCALDRYERHELTQAQLSDLMSELVAFTSETHTRYTERWNFDRWEEVSYKELHEGDIFRTTSDVKGTPWITIEGSSVFQADEDAYENADGVMEVPSYPMPEWARKVSSIIGV